MSAKPIRLLVVDDSALARKIITTSLAPFADIEIVGTAADPYAARDKILELRPDVVTLDIEMPRMDGITFLKVIMKHRPMPVIIMSSLTQAGSLKALEALQAGAVDVMEKPGGNFSAHADGTRLAEKIRAAAGARVRAASAESRFVRPPPGAGAGRLGPRSAVFPARRIILLGASTGGTEALKTLLTSLPGRPAGHLHRATHSGLFFQGVCRPAQPNLPDGSPGSRPRGRCQAGFGADRAGRPASAAEMAGGPLRGGIERRPARPSSAAVG